MTGPNTKPLRLLAFVAGEIVVAALLATTMAIALFYQPTGAWVVAPLIVIAGFIAIIVLAKRNARLARILVFVCPAAYTACLVAFGLTAEAISDFIGVSIYYALGVALFWAHLALNKYVR